MALNREEGFKSTEIFSCKGFVEKLHQNGFLVFSDDLEKKVTTITSYTFENENIVKTLGINNNQVKF